LEIKPYIREVDAIGMNQWLQQMELYFNMHEVTGKQKIYFARLKLEGHALTWWESGIVSRSLGNKPPVTVWEVFKDMIKSQFYPIGYGEHQKIVWCYFKQRQG
jgi:hypothetical protein